MNAAADSVTDEMKIRQESNSEADEKSPRRQSFGCATGSRDRVWVCWNFRIKTFYNNSNLNKICQKKFIGYAASKGLGHGSKTASIVT